MNIKRIISAGLILTALIMPLSLASCGNDSQSVTMGDDQIVKEDGKISTTPYSASYNDDGTFTLNVAIYNGTKFSKILNTVNIDKLTDSKDRIIVQNGSFELEDKKYLEPKTISYIECVFDADQVENKVKLDELNSTISLEFYGCMYKAAKPEKSDKEGYLMTVINGEITETGGFEGTVCLRNNYKTAMKPTTISFDVYDNTGRKLNNNTIVKTNDVSIDAGGTYNYSLGLSYDNVNEEISISRDFDTLEIRNLKVS